MDAGLHGLTAAWPEILTDKTMLTNPSKETSPNGNQCVQVNLYLLGPEDIVRHLLPEGADLASVKRAYEVGGVQFHRLGVDQKADPFLGQNEERDRLARAFEALLRLDQEVQHRAKAIFSANHLGDHGFSASVTFTYDPVRDKAKG